jgi:hypothetical protein
MVLGEILGGALTLYRRNFAVFLGIVAVALPISLAISIGSMAIPVRAGTLLAVLLLGLVGEVVSLVTAAAIAYSVANIADGVPARFGRSYRQVLGRLGDLFLAALRGVVVPLLIAVTIIGIPFAIYLWIRWGFFSQAVVIENQPPREAISLSGDIVEGSWWRTFGIVATVMIIGLVASLPSSAISWTASHPTGQLLGVFVSVVLRPFTAGAYTLLFFDLSSRRSQHVSVA